jgi:hypothetical protein
MSKQQFITQYVISFLACEAIVSSAYIRSDSWDLIVDDSRNEHIYPSTNMAYEAAEAAWKKLISDGHLKNLEDE